jgi:hypothetical protein
MPENSGFPKLHDRHYIVPRCRTIISDAVSKAIRDYNPTYAELLAVLSGELSGWVNYQIRDERYPEKAVDAGLSHGIPEVPDAH